MDCDLILVVPAQDWADDEQEDEFALAESLLPADAEYAGSIARGTAIPVSRPPVCGAATRSPNASPRWRESGRGDSHLYTYQQEPIGPGPIQRVELRTLELPE